MHAENVCPGKGRLALAGTVVNRHGHVKRVYGSIGLTAKHKVSVPKVPSVPVVNAVSNDAVPNATGNRAKERVCAQRVR